MFNSLQLHDQHILQANHGTQLDSEISTVNVVLPIPEISDKYSVPFQLLEEQTSRETVDVLRGLEEQTRCSKV